MPARHPRFSPPRGALRVVTGRAAAKQTRTLFRIRAQSIISASPRRPSNDAARAIPNSNGYVNLWEHAASSLEVSVSGAHAPRGALSTGVRRISIRRLSGALKTKR